MNKNLPIPLRKSAIILLWLLVWQASSWGLHNNIVLVGPLETMAALFQLIPTREFWLSIAHSFIKINLGFLMAFAFGVLLGSAAYVFSFVREFLEPVITLLKSIPVASFVILALIWAGSSQLSMVIAGLVVFPVIYINTLAGLQSTDQKLLEMAKVFRLPLWRAFRYIYLPALLPYLISGCRVALGMSWKSGVAAEVIGVPAHSIGEKLYMSKICLDTAGLFAWTAVIIAVSTLFERLFLKLLSYQTRNGASAYGNSGNTSSTSL